MTFHSRVALLLALIISHSSDTSCAAAERPRHPQPQQPRARAFIQRTSTGTKSPSPPLQTYTAKPDTESTWSDILKRPIRISSLETWSKQSRAKRIAILIRPFALHLTVLSSLSPLLFNGALSASCSAAGGTDTGSGSSTGLNVRRALEWTACMTSWHTSLNPGSV